MAEGTFPKADGDILYGSEANFFHSKVEQIDVTTDLDVNIGAGATDTANKEYALTVDNNADYLDLLIMGYFDLEPQLENNHAYIETKIEIKETGGFYGTVFDETIAYIRVSNANEYLKGIKDINWLHTLTAGQKTNGVTVKITLTATGIANEPCTWTNKQINFRWQ